MVFSLQQLYKLNTEASETLSRVLKAGKSQDVENLNTAALLKLNKDPLIKFIGDLSKQLENSLTVCNAASLKIEEMTNREIETSRKMLKLQEEQLDSVRESVKQDVTSSVRDSMKSELKSWASVAANSSKPTDAVVKKTVQKAVNSAMESDSRSKNLIMYGVKEKSTTEDLSTMVHEILQEVAHPVPEIMGASRVGVQKEGSSRPIKVTLFHAENVKYVLGKASKLRTAESSTVDFAKIYLAPDRSKEERIAHQQLVMEMKRLATEKPTQRHIIRNGRVISFDKNV